MPKEFHDLEQMEEESDDFYDDETRERLLENDEIDAFEAGFMEGVEMEENFVHCYNCGIPINDDDRENIVEKEIDGHIRLFCSESCYEDYMSRNQLEE